MTFQTQYTMEFGDILAFYFTCAKCQTKISMPIANEQPQIECPVCIKGENKWFGEHDTEYRVLREFRDALMILKKLDKMAPRHIHLEIKKPE